MAKRILVFFPNIFSVQGFGSVHAFDELADVAVVVELEVVAAHQHLEERSGLSARAE